MRQATLEKIVFSLAPALCLMLQFLLLGVVGSVVLLLALSVLLLRSRHYSSAQKTLLGGLWLVAVAAAVGFYYFFGAAVDAADSGTLTATESALPWVFAALVGLAIIVNLFCGLLLRQREVTVATS